MRYWADDESKSIYDTTIKQWLDMLTNENWHSERLVVEAIIDGREDNIRTAMLLWMMHMNYGHVPNELCELRKKLYKEMEEE